MRQLDSIDPIDKITREQLIERYTQMRPCVVGGEPDKDVTDPHTVWLIVGCQQFCLDQYQDNKDEANWMRSMLANALHQVIKDVGISSQCSEVAQLRTEWEGWQQENEGLRSENEQLRQEREELRKLLERVQKRTFYSNSANSAQEAHILGMDIDAALPQPGTALEVLKTVRT